MTMNDPTPLERKISPVAAMFNQRKRPPWESRHHWRKFNNSKRKTLRTHRQG